MLDMGNHSSFKFRLRKILEGVDGGDIVFANVNSKSMNIGISEAKEYVEDKVEKEDLIKEKADEILALLERFSKYR
jgi:hypothetical protein